MSLNMPKWLEPQKPSAANQVARTFVGGPLDGECIVLDEGTCGLNTPVPTKYRKHPEVPEWCRYFINSEGDMQFVCRAEGIEGLFRMDEPGAVA